ncbi:MULTISPECIES: hypothetical protein [unclassified Massilia]|uniref:hypothetical protein n=1 Tax=unclassified Massilia TaxID=2609279 RepID=UPI0017824D6D|nr:MULTISPECIES: hypothetical protein [unclassified Massilia]MBD8531546.1 hypothetical protein [Massilia sp. CFBP 13647]MBD8673658.1 hypothetical protein [Massilia sp. CFBP 13721]
MLSREALRQAAHSVPAVLVDSTQLLELLDAVDQVKTKTKAAKSARETNPDDERCARWLFGVLVSAAPQSREPNYTTWANDVRLMRERDGRTHRQICELFQWAHSDRFWTRNIHCPKTLRDKWGRLAQQRDGTVASVLRTVPALGKAGAATAQNAARWLEEHGNAA